MLRSKGVVSEDGTKIYSFGMWNCLETLTWQSEEDIQKIAEDRDPMEAPSCHYKVRIPMFVFHNFIEPALDENIYVLM